MASSRASPTPVWDASGDTSSLLLRATAAYSGCTWTTPALWATYHAPYIALWDTRAAKIITSPPMVGFMDFHDPYMQWYRRMTQRFTIPPLHRDDMRFHTTAGSTHLLVS